ncbi:MAG: hypothetical protein OXE74_07315 [Cyanobacteria bacterium MAG CAR2_bin_4]|nr:hypothetical protein [Cyanobacteria bacterium MAG CAR2_bin_4]
MSDAIASRSLRICSRALFPAEKVEMVMNTIPITTMVNVTLLPAVIPV